MRIKEITLASDPYVQLQPGTKRYKLNGCSILVSPPVAGHCGWHLSISHARRNPRWSEIKKARYELLPEDITVAMILPRPRDYINIHEYCFHLHQVDDKYANI